MRKIQLEAALYFANPWGLVGLVSLPIIVAIHLYHRRFPPLQVAGLHLWTQDVRKDSPGRKRESLPITRSLILELLAALLISLLLADPRFDNAESTPHLIVILDDSASMGARIDGKSSRDRAAEWIQQAKDSLGRTALYSVLTSGARPTLIAGPRCAWEDVEVALQKWQPQSPRHDFQPTWDLAAQLAGEAEGRMVFLTDRIPEEEISLPQRMETFALGRTSGNIGLTTARWLFDAETGEGTLFARVANFGTTDQEVQISGKSNNSSILTQSVPLAAQSEKSLEWTVPGGLRQIDLSLATPDDPLAIDNLVTLIEPSARKLTVAVTLPSSHSAFEPIKRILGVLPNVQLGDPADADLIIGASNDDPPASRNTWWIGIGPSVSSEDGKELPGTIGPFLLEKQNPLMDGIVMGGVVWGGIDQLEAELIPIISAGSSILLGQLPNSVGTAYLLNIDLARSNLTETPDWPIFWTNLMQQCQESRPGFRRWNYRLDESIAFTLPSELLEKEEELKLVHEGDQKTLVRMESILISPRNETGIYEIYDGETLIDRFAVNFFDRDESNLTALNNGRREPEQAGAALGIHVDNPFSWMLVLGILVVTGALLWDWTITTQQNRTKPATPSWQRAST